MGLRWGLLGPVKHHDVGPHGSHLCKPGRVGHGRGRAGSSLGALQICPPEEGAESQHLSALPPKCGLGD